MYHYLASFHAFRLWQHRFCCNLCDTSAERVILVIVCAAGNAITSDMSC